MCQKLVSHNEDIRRLLEKGYAISEDSNYLIVRDIPYLGELKQLKKGAIVTKLVFPTNNEHAVQDDHQIFFAGSVPYNMDGKPIPNLGGGACQLALSEESKDVIVERSFSNKPRVAGKFADFFEKIESYVRIISGPAMELYGADANPYTFRSIEAAKSSSVFKFRDTLTSRAEITDLSAKFSNDVIAIIGLGGTGAYLLDFLVKTPVREIRGFDRDPYHVHNAFRSPGRLLDQGELGKSKAEVYQARYENFRTGLRLEDKFIDNSSEKELEGVTFAFVCVDKGSSRDGIFNLLISKGIPFIDVGMGLKRKQGPLSGMLRTTHYSVENAQKLKEKGFAPLTDSQNDIYKTNIQIGELNALNACFAVLRFKQIRGFYFEEAPLFHLLFNIGDFGLRGETKIED